MAAIGSFIDRIQIGNNESSQIAIGSSAYTVCSTGASTATKTASMAGFILQTGTTVHVKFTNGNTAENPTLNINNTGDKAIYTNTASHIEDFDSGVVLTLTYDGTNWITSWGSGGGSGDVEFNFLSSGVLYADVTNGVTTIDVKNLKDNTSASAILSSSTDLITERTIYYGLPQINNSHSYTSNTNIFAPTSQGSEGQILISSGNSLIPTWAAAASITSQVSSTAGSSAYTILELGNDVAVSSSSNHSEGKLIIYSSGTDCHILNGANSGNTNVTEYTHTLLDSSGYLLQITSLSAVGSNTQPVYISATGVPIALTYTPNRLYYGETLTSSQLENNITTTENFIASSHFVNSTQVAINSTTAPTENLYVNGTVKISGASIFESTTDASSVNDAAVEFDGGVGIAKKLYVGTSLYVGTAISAPSLSIVATTPGLGRVDIGDVIGSTSHVIQISGSTLISSNSSDVAHLNIATESTAPILQFIPETSGTGYIGTSSARWKAANFSNSISLLNESNSTSASILLETINSSNLCSTITMTHSAPNIKLVTVGTGHVDWEIINDSNTFKIQNSSISMYGVTNGFQFNANVGINTTPATIETSTSNSTNVYNMNALTVNGSILLTYDTHNAAYLKVITNTVSTTNVYGLEFYPGIDGVGSIGLNSARWNSGYFYSTLQVGNNNSGTLNGTLITSTNNSSTWTNEIEVAGNSDGHILLQVNDNGSTTIESKIAIKANVPTIHLTTMDSSKNQWTISNNTNGVFSIDNQETTNSSLIGKSNGFEIQPRLYINETLPSTIITDYKLYVGGDSFMDGNIIPSLNSNSVPDKNLGSTSNHWAKLYVGVDDSYGSIYLPVYWYNGVPTTATGLVQYKSFTIAQNTTSVTLSHAAYSTDTIVLQIVVTAGEDYLKGPISSTTQLNQLTQIGEVVLTTTTSVSGAVSGYILTVRGVSLDN